MWDHLIFGVWIILLKQIFKVTNFTGYIVLIFFFLLKILHCMYVTAFYLIIHQFLDVCFLPHFGYSE